MRKKFLSICFLIIFTTSSIMGLVFDRMMKDNYIETLYHNGITEGKFISMVMGEVGNTSVSFYRLAQFFGKRSNYRVTFLNDKGVPIADSVDNSVIFKHDENISEEGINKIYFPFYSLRKNENNKEREIKVYSNVININGNRYILVLSKDLARFKEFQKQILAIIALSFVISGMITVIISILVIDKAITPILTLTKATKNISKGNFNNAISVKGSDEIEELAESFNSMQKRIAILLNKIEEKASNLQLVLDNLSDSVFVINMKGDVVLLNKSAKREFQLTKRHKSLYDYKELNFIAPIIKEAIEEKRELNIKGTNNGETYQILLNYIDGAEDQAIITVENISVVENGEKFRREFISSASHELKTPITIISGFVETIKLGHVKDETQLNSFLNIIEKEILRLTSLTDNLLKLSHLENSSKENEKSYKINLKNITDLIVIAFRNIAKKKGIEIESIAEDISVDLPLSEEWLRVVLGNLIENGIKYSPNDTKISVKIEDGKDDIKLSVADEGTGIEKSEIKNIFRRFYRIDKSRNRKIEGNGLGLSIVKNMVEKLSGTIDVESEVGRGTKITISIPKIGK